MKKILTKKALAQKKKEKTIKKFEKFFKGEGFDARTITGKLLKNVKDFDRKTLPDIPNSRLNFSGLLKNSIYTVEQTWQNSKKGPKAMEKIEKMIKDIRNNTNEIMSGDKYLEVRVDRNGKEYYLWRIDAFDTWEYMNEQQVEQLQQNRKELHKKPLQIKERVKKR